MAKGGRGNQFRCKDRKGQALHHGQVRQERMRQDKLTGPGILVISSWFNEQSAKQIRRKLMKLRCLVTFTVGVLVCTMPIASALAAVGQITVFKAKRFRTMDPG